MGALAWGADGTWLAVGWRDGHVDVLTATGVLEWSVQQSKFSKFCHFLTRNFDTIWLVFDCIGTDFCK